MAEIKSSLDIALERAAALSGDEPGGVAAALGEMEGKRLGRKAVAGELGEGGMIKALEALAADSRDAAGKAAAAAILDAEEGDMEAALEGLLELAQWKGVPGAAGQFARALMGVGQAQKRLHERLTAGMTARLEEAGIKGGALRPNPLAHQEYARLREDALAPAKKSLEDARWACKEALTS